MTWIRRLLRRETPPRLHWRKPPRRSPGWHVNNGGWPVGHTADDLTAEEIGDVFRPARRED